jgi:hypothetical protein
MADLDGEDAVGGEVVEFEHVADGGGQCCALDAERLHLLDHGRHTGISGSILFRFNRLAALRRNIH